MKELAGGKCMENDCFLRTLKFKIKAFCYTNEDRISDIEGRKGGVNYGGL
jgi:hypothetical protein